MRAVSFKAAAKALRHRKVRKLGRDVDCVAFRVLGLNFKPFKPFKPLKLFKPFKPFKPFRLFKSFKPLKPCKPKRPLSPVIVKLFLTGSVSGGLGRQFLGFRVSGFRGLGFRPLGFDRGFKGYRRGSCLWAHMKGTCSHPKLGPGVGPYFLLLVVGFPDSPIKPNRVPLSLS